jgi:hypothetical protein
MFGIMDIIKENISSILLTGNWMFTILYPYYSEVGGMLEKYVGRIVEIIYVDKHYKITQRLIEVRAVEGDTVKAYCLKQKAPRVFKLASILAVWPISRAKSG